MNKNMKYKIIQKIKITCTKYPDSNIVLFLKSGYVKNAHFINEYMVAMEEMPDGELAKMTRDCLFWLLSITEMQREKCIKTAFEEMKIKRTSRFKRNMYDILSYITYWMGYVELSEKFSKDICGRLMLDEILNRGQRIKRK